MAASIYFTGVQYADQIYGLLCKELLPVSLLRMVIASVLSATMSTLSSDFNAVVSVLSRHCKLRLSGRRNAGHRGPIAAVHLPAQRVSVGRPAGVASETVTGLAGCGCFAQIPIKSTLSSDLQ